MNACSYHRQERKIGGLMRGDPDHLRSYTIHPQPPVADLLSHRPSQADDAMLTFFGVSKIHYQRCS